MKSFSYYLNFKTIRFLNFLSLNWNVFYLLWRFRSCLSQPAGCLALRCVVFCAGVMLMFSVFSHLCVFLGTSIVAVMIGNFRGMELVQLLEKSVSVSIAIELGKQHGPWMSQYSVFFVSISFFVVTAATVGYFIFYSARRLTSLRQQNRKQVQHKIWPQVWLAFKPQSCGNHHTKSSYGGNYDAIKLYLLIAD